MNAIAGRYPAGFLRSYARLKLASDTVYDAVYESLRGTALPVLDIGCGIGLLAQYLRERGYLAPISGIDHDPRKIEIARRVAESGGGMTFDVADARSAADFRGAVVLLDVLHYFDDASQQMILRNASNGAAVIIRDAIRDGSFRYRLTYAQEALSRAAGWLKAERLHFPTRQAIEGSFNGEFRRDVRPMFGRSPFNNYLFVFKRSSEGTTKS